jgi:hypothetical protein
MNAEQAIEQTGQRAVVEKLEELAQTAGGEGTYAVDRAPDGRVHSIALLDEDGQNAEVVVLPDGRLNVVMWFARGWDVSLNTRGQNIRQEEFEALIDDRISGIQNASQPA